MSANAQEPASKKTALFDNRARGVPDQARRALLVKATSALGGLAIAGASYPFLASLAPSERARALGAPVEIDVGAVGAGEMETVVWQGKPVWILRRTAGMLAGLESARRFLTDPDSQVKSQQPEYARNAARALRPEVFVSLGLCTHLGCVPNYMPQPGSVQADWPGGFYCPCHGSKFDLAGRVFAGSPAPSNLVVPPYYYAGSDRLVIGADGTKAV
jgi:ubiquinol-cytochrome c reductase iron-sulfur subunit